MTGNQAGMAEFLSANQAKLIDRWHEIASDSLGDRVSGAELRREQEELFGLIVRFISGSDESAGGELRAVLAELSRSRARLGFTPTETVLASDIPCEDARPG